VSSTYPPHGGGDPPSYPPPYGPPPAPDRTARTAVLAAISTVAIVAIIGGAYLIGRSGDGPPETTTTTTLPPVTTTVPPPPTAAPTPAPAPESTAAVAPVETPVGDVRQAAEGLLCRDLHDRGYSYSASVDYWRLWGQPNRMDADKNGIPCETVYPRGDVVAYWPASTYSVSVSYGLPSGLLCRDLEARGVGVYDALRYYIWEGYPERMDADHNGIPCETVYPDAAAVWTYEF